MKLFILYENKADRIAKVLNLYHNAGSPGEKQAAYNAYIRITGQAPPQRYQQQQAPQQQRARTQQGHQTGQWAQQQAQQFRQEFEQYKQNKAERAKQRAHNIQNLARLYQGISPLALADVLSNHLSKETDAKKVAQAMISHVKNLYEQSNEPLDKKVVSLGGKGWYRFIQELMAEKATDKLRIAYRLSPLI